MQSFYIMNIDDPTNPIVEASLSEFYSYGGCIERGLYVSNNLAFLTINGGPIGIIDVRDSKNPKYIYETPGLSAIQRGIAVAGSYCYAGGFYIIDISNCKPEVPKFVFPVLGNSITDPLKNINDPIQDGWHGPGVGQFSADKGHLGQDYILDRGDTGGDAAGKPVYAITKGEVVEVMNHDGPYYGWPCDGKSPDHGWGPVVVLKHTSDTGFKVSDNAIIPLGNCGTDRNPKVIYSLYGHLSLDSIKGITVGDTFEAGAKIGLIGKCGVDLISWTTNHLHFEIKDEIGFWEGSWYVSHHGDGECSGSIAQACDAQGIGTGYSYFAKFAPHRYIPSVFILDNQGRKGYLPGVMNLLLSY